METPLNTSGNAIFFNSIYTSLQNQFILAANTPLTNPCGLIAKHAFSILAAFNITASNGTEINALLIR